MNRTSVTKREKTSYGMYFLGQNIFFGLVGYMTIFFTDIGLAAAMVAVIALITKVWDAVNDPILGALMDKIKFKRGKFVPWLRISIIAIPLSTIMIFAIPSGISMWGKAIWATIAYVLWDAAYTICDVPIFALVTTMTSDQKERLSLNSIGRIFAMFAGIIVAIIVPLFRQKIGGWTATIVSLSVIGFVTMIPICLFANERVIDAEKENKEKEESYKIKDMIKCLRKNKYLLIFFSSSILSSLLNVGATWGLYIARYCLGGEEKSSYVTMAAILPMFIGAFVTPILCKRIDKFKVFYTATVVGLFLSIIKFLAGYDNFMIYLILSAVSMFPAGVASMLMFQFTPDCYEYGQYKTGLKMRGVTFAAQTFFVKLAGALSAAVSTFALTIIGFVEGEGAIQSIGFSDKLWNYSCLGGIIGTTVILLVLRFYKLNDHDVQLMAKYNIGEITREEADKAMHHKY